jgi:hypothetical protein
MRKISIKGWEIEIDLEKTHQYYSKLNEDDLLTCCVYCRNYYYGIGKSSDTLIDFFNILGIVPEKTVHLSELTKLDNGKHLYDADYLLCGNILVKPIEVESISENGTLVIKPIELTDGISFHFSSKRPSYINSDICPQPLLILQIVCEVPWVIDELTV